MMSIFRARLESSAIAGAQHLLAAIRDQHHLPGDDIHEFIFRRMPMALARPAPGRQAQQVHAKIRQARRVPQPLPHAGGAGGIERLRIARP
jgi:hypothetical protein